MEVERSTMWGTMKATIDGQPLTLQSAWDPSTHFNFQLKRQYPIVVGQSEQHQVVIEHERPLWFAGFRPHKYRVYVDGGLLLEQEGY